MEELEKKTETAENAAEMTETAEETPAEEVVSIKRNKEKLGDILLMQIALCVLLLLIAAVLSIFEPELVRRLISGVRELTDRETEEIYRRAAETVMRYIR